ncbi:MAG TPA: MarC family protein [Caulobacteraceae bacterium]
MTLFLATFTTLLAIINPLEALPVYLGFVEGKDLKARRSLAIRSCLYALALMFFFLVFGRLLLELFGVSLSMVRIAGGIILTGIGFQLFSSPSSIAQSASAGPGEGAGEGAGDPAFIPLAMPIMFGPGAMATIMGMASEVKRSPTVLLGLGEVSAALVATMAVTLLFLGTAQRLQKRLSPRAIDAATRIVGFFVASVGIGMAFDGIMQGLQEHGVGYLH